MASTRLEGSRGDATFAPSRGARGELALADAITGKAPVMLLPVGEEHICGGEALLWPGRSPRKDTSARISCAKVRRRGLVTPAHVDRAASRLKDCLAAALSVRRAVRSLVSSDSKGVSAACGCGECWGSSGRPDSRAPRRSRTHDECCGAAPSHMHSVCDRGNDAG
eukprot:scaffold32106_cov146-Isochrysis_galbana.AAC.1